MCSPRHAMPGNHADGTIRLLAIWGVTLTLAFAATFAHAITLTAAQSRKSHGAAGTFDLPIDTTQNIGGAVTVEPRAIGAGHMIVFQFDAPITAIGIPAAFDEAGAPVGALTASAAGNDVVVTLAGVPDNKRVMVLLSNVNGAGVDVFASLGFLVGDVNNSRSVTATDILQVKGRSGQGVDATNFKFDLNASGAITATDILQVKGRSGQVLPPASGFQLYVAALVGNDANPGTKQAPLKTIGAAIQRALAAARPFDILVAEGSYPEKVTLAKVVSLLGGHSCAAAPCTWVRDPAVYDTAIVNQDLEGVLAPSSVTRATRLEGFRITGMSGTPSTAPLWSAAVTLKGGTPTVRENRIQAGNVTGGISRSIGVAVMAPTTDPQGALLDANDIAAGSAPSIAAAVLFDALIYPAPSPAIAVVTNNVLRGGTGAAPAGIAAFASGPGTVVKGNQILAGTATASGESWGILVTSSMTINANRINADQATAGGCSGTKWCGGIQSSSATATITNNVIFGLRAPNSAAVQLAEFEAPAGTLILNANYLDAGGLATLTTGSRSASVLLRIGTCSVCGFNLIVGRVRNNILLGGVNERRYGVLEEPPPPPGKTVRPEALDNNDFWFVPATGRTDVLYRQVNAAGSVTDITTVSNLTSLVVMPQNNFSADPLVDATFHLMAGSPCINAGTTTEAPTTDFDGETRPKGAAVDVGPDEAM